MKVSSVIQHLEALAPPALQESYDNCGLLTGNPDWECTGVLCALDATEAVVEEAIRQNCNLVVAHHPIIFSGLKKMNGKNYVERVVIRALKQDIALYAIHTSLDNVSGGVNSRIADLLELHDRKVLVPKGNSLCKLYTYVPLAQAGIVKDALFAAGAGHIGQYSECSFSTEGTGTFKAGAGTQPFVGRQGERHLEPEVKVEVVLPAYLSGKVVEALLQAHPYEEVAYELVNLLNPSPGKGSGLIGNLPRPYPVAEFLGKLKSSFGCRVVRHTTTARETIARVAVCGGAGSFLISNALSADADAFVTADLKYHEFFDADNRLLLCDIGHYESEQFTTDLLAEVLQQKFPNFAVLKSDQITNPVHYYF